jgi:4-amino-4-deoxy-L-arabinose transferase-like glycosyltransferase/lipopolysaccharide biosynthesis regulator YciM
VIKRLNFNLVWFVCDFVLIDVALYLARQLRLILGLGRDLGPESEWLRLHPLLYLVVPLIWVTVFTLLSAYDHRRTRRTADELKIVALTMVLTTLALVGLSYFLFPDLSRLLLFYFLILGLLFLSTWRFLLRPGFRVQAGGWFREKRRLFVEGAKIRHGEFTALGLLIVLVSLVNVVWIRQDTRPQPGWDANVYLANTLHFVERLDRHGAAQLQKTVASLSFESRSPLYQLLSVPSFYLFGRSADAALYVNILFEALLLLSVYGIGRLVKNGRAGLLAALLVATYPPTISLSKIYRPHFAVLACVALSLWLLLLLLKTRAEKIAWLFGASLGVGLLIHVNFLFLLIAPTILFGFYALLFQTAPRYPPGLRETPRWLLAKLRDPFVLRGLLPAALIAAGLTATWYLPTARSLIKVRVDSLAAGVAGKRALGFSGIPHFFWWYALTMPGAISYVFTALLAIGLVFGAIKRRWGDSVLVITFLLMYVGFALRPGGLAWLYFAAVLPVIAVITAAWCVDVRPRRFSTVLTVVCVSVAIFNFSVVTWGVQPWSQPIVKALGAPLDSGTCATRLNQAFCPWPARDEDWRVGDILQVIQNDSHCQEHLCGLMIMHIREYTNSRVFYYYLARDFPDLRLRVSDLVPGIADSRRLQVLLDSKYQLYIPASRAKASNFQQRLRQFVQSPPPAYARAHQEVASFELPDGKIARLVKRINPLTLEEAEVSIATLDVSRKDMDGFLQGLVRDEMQRLTSNIEEQLDAGATKEVFDLAMQILESDALNAEEKAALAINVGNQLTNMGETGRAIKLLNQVAPDTDAAGVWIILGKAYRRGGRLDEAISAFEQALVLDPRRYWANHLLAGIYANQGKWEATVPLAQVALEVAPDDAHYVNSGVRLIQAYENLGDQRSACVVLQRVAQWTEPGDTRIENLNERLACQD